GAATSSASKIDLRAFSQKDRAMLTKGDKVRVRIGKAKFIEIPRTLLVAASTKANTLISGNEVNSLEEITWNGADKVIQYILLLARTPNKDFNISFPMSISDMMSVTAAAEALGMGKYTSHIYKRCEAILRNENLEFEDMDACTHFREHHPRFFHILGERLAFQWIDNTILDIDEFKVYI
ncbi:hypothetical protein GQ44DRAFT_551118, partial [Phaeosphaeriaceae sp. PMI808]